MTKRRAERRKRRRLRGRKLLIAGASIAGASIFGACGLVEDEPIGNTVAPAPEDPMPDDTEDEAADVTESNTNANDAISRDDSEELTPEGEGLDNDERGPGEGAAIGGEDSDPLEGLEGPPSTRRRAPGQQGAMEEEEEADPL